MTTPRPTILRRRHNHPLRGYPVSATLRMSDNRLPLSLTPFAHDRDDPAALVKRLWGHVNLQEYQAEILNSVRDNKQTFVHSGHKMGKSLTAALATMWFFLTRSPATVLLISAKEQQLEQVMWAEILTLVQRSKEKLPVAVNRLRLRLRADDGDGYVPRHEVLGCAANEPESLQGHNLPPGDDGEPSVLVVCEEASAIPDRFIEALLPQSHRLLAIGNPLRVEGWFYEGCKKGDEAYPEFAEGESSRPRDGETEGRSEPLVGGDQFSPPLCPSLAPSPLVGQRDLRVACPTLRPEGEGTHKLLRKVRHVHPEQSPNVRWSREMDQRGEKGPYPIRVYGLLTRQEFDEWNATWDEPRKRVRLFGELPNEEEQKLFPPSWLDLAQRLGTKLREQMQRHKRWRDDSPYALGIDVASGGGDLTAWVVLGRWGVRHLHAKPTPNTASISGETIELMRRYRIKAWAVAFDAGGGGKQVADVLRAQDDMEFGAIVDVSFGAKALDGKKYNNRRTELYGELRIVLEATDERRGLLALPVSEWPHEVQCLALPPDDPRLREDLAVLPYAWDTEGLLRLPPKDHRWAGSSQREKSVRERLHGRSPDRGDALALAWFAWTRSSEYQRLERVERPLFYT
jgi:hypothetical protein